MTKMNSLCFATEYHHRLVKFLLPLVLLPGEAYAQVPISEGDETPVMVARRVEEVPTIDGHYVFIRI